MAKNETIIKYLQEASDVRGLVLEEDWDTLNRVISCDAIDFMDLTEAQHRLFSDFALDYITGIHPDNRCRELTELLAERMLYLAPNVAANDRFARALLVSAAKQELLERTENYRTDARGRRTTDTVYTMKQLIGPLPQEIKALSRQVSNVPAPKNGFVLALCLVLFLGALAALALNLFVPSVSQILTQEKWKFLYTVIIGLVSAVPLGTAGFLGVAFGWIVMGLLGSFMFNMIPIEYAMKVHSLAATAWTILAFGFLLFTNARAFTKQGQQERAEKIRQAEEKAEKMRTYVNRVIHTLKNETPMVNGGFRDDPEELKHRMEFYLESYCLSLREEMGKLWEHVPK